MRVEADRRLHRDQRQQLEQMVRHHVAQRAGCVVEAAAVADAEFLVDRDLHVVDVVAVPDRLEHAVGEAQHQDVLDGLLAEIVIDPVDLVLVDELQQFAVQRPGRGQVGAERLFDHQPPPACRSPSACRCGRAARRSAGRRWAASPDRTGGCRRFRAPPRGCRAGRAARRTRRAPSGRPRRQVTHSNRRLAIASSTGRVANWRRPFIRLPVSSSLVMPLRATPTTQNLSGSRSLAARL